jgi:hypothetical protein
MQRQVQFIEELLQVILDWLQEGVIHPGASGFKSSSCGCKWVQVIEDWMQFIQVRVQFIDDLELVIQEWFQVG